MSKLQKPTKGLYVDVDLKLSERIRKYCFKNGISKRGFIEAAAKEYLANNKNERNARKSKKWGSRVRAYGC